jgi:hypothetical protein
MYTNDLKKGDKVILSNGWLATIMDNKKGTIRMAEVQGHYTEIGSVYAHDIAYAFTGVDGDTEKWDKVKHTDAQLKLKSTISKMGF